MNGISGCPKPGKAMGEHAPYCAFKDDRERRLALISRDLRKVAIVIILVTFAWPPVSAPVSLFWSGFSASR